MSRRLSRSTLTLGALALCCGIVLSHDQILVDFMGPYVGPGYSGSATTALGGGITSGTAALDFPRSNVTLLSWLPLDQFGPGQENGNDCWGYTSNSGTEYAILGMHAGTGFVDLSDPGSPQVVSTIPGPHSAWRDMKVYQDYCYAVSEGSSGTMGTSGGGIQVMDLSQIDQGTVTLVNTVLTPGIEDTHNVAIDEVSGFLYRVGGNSRGLRVYDLTNPASPVFVGAHDDRYVHDAQIVTYTTGPFANRQIAFCGAGTGSSGFGDPSVDIVDVTDKQNMFLVKRVYYPNPAYSHQVWLSEDRQLLYVNDELDEDGIVPTTTHVIDVSNLATASHVSSFDNGNTAIGHNLYTANGLIYEANYRSGIRVFETSNPLAPTEIAFFDSYLEDDNPNFNGAWSVYPYFQSGVVLASDLEKGIFVLWVGERLLDFSYPAGVPTLLDPAGMSFTVHIEEAASGQLQAGTPALHIDSGSGFMALPMTDLGAGDYLATFPAIPCGEFVSWFVSARSSNGILWKDAEDAPAVSYFAPSATRIAPDLFDDGESIAGWTVGAVTDTATMGVWENGVPLVGAEQPGEDHTPGAGTRCWITQLSDGHTGGAPVDGGATTLLSPVFDLSGAASARIQYWRWYSNDSFQLVDDSFVVDITSDGGANWTNLETLAPGDPETSGGWFSASFRVDDFVPLTASVQLRFIASDSGPMSLVEAAIDDLTVQGFDCDSPGFPSLCLGDGGDQLGCTECSCGNNAPIGPAASGGCLNSNGTSARLDGSGAPSVSLPSGSVSDLRFELIGAPPSSFCILNSGDGVAPGNAASPCFGLGSGVNAAQFDGLRCAIMNTRRHGGRSADSNGEVGVTNAPWGGEGGPPIGIASGFASGQTRFFQAIYRDDALLSCMTGLNTSQAVEVLFAP